MYINHQAKIVSQECADSTNDFTYFLLLSRRCMIMYKKLYTALFVYLYENYANNLFEKEKKFPTVVMYTMLYLQLQYIGWALLYNLHIC